MDVFPRIAKDTIVYFDYFSLNLYSPPHDFKNDTTISINLVSSWRDTMRPSPYIFIPTYYKFKTDTTLLNVAFQEVYCNIKTINDPPNSVYYSKALGMIAFTDLDDVLWVFDRVE